jgi:hypothetical protein
VCADLTGDREDRFFPTVFVGSGFQFVAMPFLPVGMGGALLTAVKSRRQPVPSAETVVTIRLAYGFLSI